MATILLLTTWGYLHLFSCCCLPNLQNCEKIRTYSSSRSSKVIDVGANRTCIYNFLLVINSNYGRNYDHFEDIYAQLENGLFSPPLPCLMPPLQGNPAEFLDKSYPAKTRGWWYCENSIIHF